MRVLKIIIGDSDSQQKLEALVVLVALRLWLDVLKTKRIILTLSSGDTSALAMASSLKITASTLIARELAMLLSEAASMPRLFHHLPGVMNGFADSLSRLDEPGSRHSNPDALRNELRLHSRRRDETFCTTLAP